MTHWINKLMVACLLGLAAAPSAQAAGLMRPADGSVPPLELRDHDVKVTIADGYAITEIEQVFHNPNASDLEAIYSFPVPRKASVGEFTYWIDGKPVTGEVMERKQAREVYESEKSAGRETALVEKDAYRTFDISVFPVRAGSEVRTRLVYIQPAHVDTGIGRYVYPLEEGGVDEEKLAFWTANETVSNHFRFELLLKSGYPVDAIRLPRHPNAHIEQLGEGHWRAVIDSRTASAPADDGAIAAEQEMQPATAAVGNSTTQATNATFDTQIRLLESGESAGSVAATPQATTPAAGRLDTDIVAYWRLRPGLPGALDMVTYRPEGSERGTFMMTVTPGVELGPVNGQRDWIFVLDRSGSMSAKLATLSEGVQRALGKLQPGDRFSILLFNDSVEQFTPGFVPVSEQAVRDWSARVASIQSQGGTNLYAGINAGLDQADADRPTGIVLVTDGVANVGVTEKKEFLELARDRDIRLFTFIMGNSANRPLLEEMTTVSGGFATSISNSDEIVGQLLAATSKLTHAALHDVEIDIDGIRTGDITPERPLTLYRGEQLIVMGHYWGDGEADVRLTARISGQPVEYTARFTMPAASSEHPELERLWAFAAIENLQREMDYLGKDADIEQAITELAIEYGLVTDFTSMIVVREEVFQQLGIDRNNERRVNEERAAREKRENQGAQDRRVDRQDPMFNQSRPSHHGGGGSGGGAASPFGLLLGLLMLGLAVRRRRSEPMT